MPAKTVEWDESLVADLKRRWEAGETSYVIAAAIGCTRSAVCGKIRRLALCRSKTKPKGGGSPKRRRKTRPRPVVTPERGAKEASVAAAVKRPQQRKSSRLLVDVMPQPLPITRARAVAGDRPAELRMAKAEIATVGRPLLDAGPFCCRWPLDGAGPALCCSAPTVGTSSWCRDHASLVYERSPASRGRSAA